ncbi:hypothetical protein [Myxacorys almedinensis]|uniref:Uncharacterized protein n=1 Tax=Myxacorys almedinensis A TaxID=2690445 RepID=A0A8J7YY35_9CYAN|nr:hypothetical protein [Myxacorys almedinensis]NDJ16782.1 hypothetical protein [Myxacorys almedinensis A]
MALVLETAQLLSRTIRINASNGVTGSALLSSNSGSVLKPRKIANLFKLKGEQEEGGILQNIWNAAATLVGWIGGLVKGITFSATAVFQWVIGRIEQLKSFDWNASDDAYKQLMESQNTRIASIWGGVVGKGLGWLAGIAIGAGVGYLCPVLGGATLAKTISTAVGVEALEEFLPAFRNALVQTAGEFANRGLLVGYMNYRNLLKRAPRPLLEAIYGAEQADFIQNTWGNKGGPNMSFNSQMDELVESIQNDALQAFVEELLDESWDSFTEAGFVIAHELDTALQQYRAGKQNENGTPRTAYLKPDKEADEVLTFTSVPQKLLQTSVQETLNSHRLIHNRDVGAIVGQPASNLGRALPQLRQLVVVFRDRPRPPWRHTNGDRCREASYTIPDVKLGLTWRDIKEVSEAYMWGKYRATAHLDNRRQMAVYGATPEDAKLKLRALLRLSTSEVLSLSITEEEDRPQKLKKTPTKMYPVYFTLLARRNTIDGQGRTTLDNTTLDETVRRIEMWGENPPAGMQPLL